MALPIGRFRLRPWRFPPAATTASRASKAPSAPQEYPRLRIGVGPVPPEQEGLADYVLDQFSKEERGALNELLDPMCGGGGVLGAEGIEAAMNRFNSLKP